MKTREEKLIEILFLVQKQLSFLLDMIVESTLSQASHDKLVNINPLRKNLLDVHRMASLAIQEYGTLVNTEIAVKFQDSLTTPVLSQPSKFNWKIFQVSILMGIIGGCSVFIAFKLTGIIP